MPIGLKKKIAAALESRDHEGLFRMWSAENRVFRTLVSMTYDRESLISWRAIETVGVLTGMKSETDSGLIRNIAGRLLWMIRDESGGIGWSIPDILGEMVRNSPVLLSDIAPIIISFHEEGMLLQGVLRAIGRIGESNRELVSDGIPVLLSCLESSDPYLCGISVWSLGKLGDAGGNDRIIGLCSDTRKLIIYSDGELHETTVGEIAKGVSVL
jgi:hypothetical protein